MMSLRTRLIVTYSVAVGALVLALGVVTNGIVDNLFLSFAKENITAHSELIVDSLSDQWNPETNTFKIEPLQALGMNFVHQGYIVSIADAQGVPIWNARTCDMDQCQIVISDIEQRMANQQQYVGELQRVTYPLTHNGQKIGEVTVETYAPFFYSQSESNFIDALNRLLIFATVALVVIVVVASVFLAGSLARPLGRVVGASQEIAGGDLTARVGESYKTKELNELAQSIDELANALEEGERYSRRLTSNIAHELRTPLTTLQGNIEAMIDGVFEPTPERLASAHEEILRLSQLVASLGQISLLEQESLQLHFTEFDIAALLSSVADQFRVVAQDKQIELRIEVEHVTVRADYDRLKQVFINLTANALNYTNEGSVSVTGGPAGNRVFVSVKDTGIGIPEEDLEHVFERFYRVDKSRARGTGGTGIGLAVASSIVQAHGGEIAAASTVGVGSEFTVSLPVG